MKMIPILNLCFLMVITAIFITSCAQKEIKTEVVKEEKPKGDAARRIYFNQRCAENDFGFCYELGLMFQRGQGGKADKLESDKYYKTACDHGVVNACRALNKDITPVQEVAIYRADCQKGYSFSCNNLGQLLMIGQGAAVNVPEGMAALEKACNANSYRACNALSQLAAKGINGPGDKEKAKKLKLKENELLNKDQERERIALGIPARSEFKVAQPSQAFIDMMKGEFDGGGPSEGMAWEKFRERSIKAANEMIEKKKEEKHNHKEKGPQEKGHEGHGH